MKLYNTLTHQLDEIKPLDGKTVRIYSCGPTVYDHAHIGNLSAYIFADTLRRAVKLAGYEVLHAMNYTDVDDKTIKRSQEEIQGGNALANLRQLTDKYIKLFNEDMTRIGNDTTALDFVRATDPEVIQGMQVLIKDLHAGGFAYVADDGVYFSIEAYRKAGKTYGQLLKLTAENTSDARIQNDEYDKESAHDFALWKKQKPGEPAWDFKLGDYDLSGRPGWHIECSVMSRQKLGQPFDIHTGGIDLIFPHHENEIAQSTALEDDPHMAQIFAHNEHILVDGKKMAKSAQNFYTLQDIVDKGYDPLAFRLLVLQSHYRSQVHFSWENLEAAQNRLQKWQAFADLRWQTKHEVNDIAANRVIRWQEPNKFIPSQLGDDLDTPQAITWIERLADDLVDFDGVIPERDQSHFVQILTLFDQAFGLNLSNRPDIEDSQKQLITERETARQTKDWAKSDQLRDQLKEQGLGIRDTAHGPIWYRS